MESSNKISVDWLIHNKRGTEDTFHCTYGPESMTLNNRSAT